MLEAAAVQSILSETELYAPKCRWRAGSKKPQQKLHYIHFTYIDGKRGGVNEPKIEEGALLEGAF